MKGKSKMIPSPPKWYWYEYECYFWKHCNYHCKHCKILKKFIKEYSRNKRKQDKRNFNERQNSLFDIN